MVSVKDRVTGDLQKYIKKGQWEKAIQALGRLSAIEPQNAVHRLRAGDYYGKLGMKPKALAAYGEAAGVFAEGGFIVKALAAYKMILRMDPQNKTATEKMQGLHGQARQQTGFSSPYIIAADKPGSEQSRSTPQSAPAAVMEAPEPSPEVPGPERTVEETPSSTAPVKALSSDTDEEESLGEGFVGVQPVDFGVYGVGSEMPGIEPTSLSDEEGGGGITDTGDTPFKVEQTSYADSRPEEDTVAQEAPPLDLEPMERSLTDVIPLFSSLNREEFTEVVDRLIHLQYPPGYRIVKEGDRGDSVYLISQGTVQVVTKIGKREVTLSELRDNDFFGEVAFLTGRPRTASVVTKTDTEILELRGEDLRSIVQKYPGIRGILEQFYKKRIRDTLSKVKQPGT